MNIDLGTVSLSTALWLISIVTLVIVIFVVVRFFFHHILHFVLRGCAILVVLVLVLVVLRLLNII